MNAHPSGLMYFADFQTLTQSPSPDGHTLEKHIHVDSRMVCEGSLG